MNYSVFQHGGHAQNIKIEVRARQGLNFECCKSGIKTHCSQESPILLEVCKGACMPIDFVELLHGESLDGMDTTERLLCKH